MNRSRKVWVALAVFAAVMTVAEAVAVQAMVRDSERWLSGEQMRGLRRATSVVTRVVKDNLMAREPGLRVIRLNELGTSDWDAVPTGMGTAKSSVPGTHRTCWMVIQDS